MRLINLKATLLFVLLLMSLNLSAQVLCENCNPKNITTNFSSPVNTEKPIKKNTFFDWTNLGNLGVFSSTFPAPYNNISSPFHQDNNAPLSHFIDNPDRLSKDGWELIKYNLGYLENGNPNGLANRDIYIVLYNKYTSILRVFVASNENIGFNGLKVKIDFISGTRTSLLSNASEIFALDIFKEKPTITGVIGYRPALWSYADFSMTYDPCTCKNDSRLKIEISYITSSTIKLNGSIDGTIVSTEPNGNIKVEKDGYSFSDISKGAMKAKKTYDDFQGFVGDQFDAIAKAGKTNLQIKSEEEMRVNSITAFQQEIKNSNFLKNGLKALPYIGAAVDLLDFFIGGGRQSDGPQEVKIMPLSLQADVTLSGKIEAQYPYPDILFNTPGSKNVPCLDDTFYPYYNEVLGIFNLIETPKIYQKNIQNSYWPLPDYDDPPDFYGPSYRLGYYQRYVHDIYQMKSIKYVVNPAAGFKTDNVEIMASLDFGNFKTAYVPLSAINSFSIETGYMETYDQYSYGSPGHTVLYCTDEAPQAIHFLINLERLDATANTQNVLIKLKFPLQVIYELPTSYAPSYCNFASGKIALANQTVSTDIYSWEEISIGPNVIFTGNRVLKSPIISVQPGGAIPANVSVQVGLPNGHVPYQVQPVSQAEIEKFCSSSTYKVKSRVVQQMIDNSSNKILNSYQNYFTLYPNPANNQVTFSYFIEEPTSVAIRVTDISGRSVANITEEVQEKGAYSYVYDTSTLMPGVYIVIFQINKTTQTEKLVVIK